MTQAATTGIGSSVQSRTAIRGARRSSSFFVTTKRASLGAVAKPLEFEEVPQGALVNPTFSLHGDEAQELMDMLWNCGLRPTQGKQSAGQLDAVERHLADMRAIAFNKLEIKPC